MEIKNSPEIKEDAKGFKFSYSKLKQCVFKKESGESTDDCRKLFKEMNVEVLD